MVPGDGGAPDGSPNDASDVDVAARLHKDLASPRDGCHGYCGAGEGGA